MWIVWAEFTYIYMYIHNVPGPLGEPVNGAAVDQRGEHTTARTEGISHRAHAEDNVQLVLDSADEVGEYPIPGCTYGRKTEHS